MQLPFLGDFPPKPLQKGRRVLALLLLLSQLRLLPVGLRRLSPGAFGVLGKFFPLGRPFFHFAPGLTQLNPEILLLLHLFPHLRMGLHGLIPPGGGFLFSGLGGFLRPAQFRQLLFQLCLFGPGISHQIFPVLIPGVDPLNFPGAANISGVEPGLTHGFRLRLAVLQIRLSPVQIFEMLLHLAPPAEFLQTGVPLFLQRFRLPAGLAAVLGNPVTQRLQQLLQIFQFRHAELFRKADSIPTFPQGLLVGIGFRNGHPTGLGLANGANAVDFLLIFLFPPGDFIHDLPENLRMKQLAENLLFILGFGPQ